MNTRRQKGVRAVDGKAESIGLDPEEIELPPDVEPEKRTYDRDAWPILTFDIAVLADPDGNPDKHAAEWRRVYNYFDPYLRYYFEDVMRYDDADEIVAAVWRGALRRIGSLDAPENAWWWFIRIGRNYFIDQWRKSKRRLTRDRKGLASIADDASEDWRDSVLEEIERENMFRETIPMSKFRDAFGGLADRDREFAYLLKVEGRTHEELVDLLHLTSVDASRQRWRWIKKKLKAALSA